VQIYAFSATASRAAVSPAHPDANGEVYNVGGNHEITILQLAERIKEMTQSSSRIVFVPYSTAYEEGFEDMRRRVPDVSKLNRLIGYAPKISLEDSLHTIIEDQRARLRQTGVLAYA
jgi:UDP-glucose 4-epimerase